MNPRLRQEWCSLLTYARAMAGGLIFGVPLLYTMEMWWLGFSLSPIRLLIALAVNLGVLLILERFSGFRQNTSFWEEVQDAIVALGMGMIAGTVLLALHKLLGAEMSLHAMLGKIVMQTIAISIGVSVAMSTISGSSASRIDKDEVGFWGNMGEAVAGSMFLALNIAATEEPVMLGMVMTPGYSLLLLCVSLLLVFAITYALQFKGGVSASDENPWWKVFIRDSTTTYAVALMLSAGTLILFDRINLETGMLPSLQMIVALGFPSALGAAFARILI